MQTFTFYENMLDNVESEVDLMNQRLDIEYYLNCELNEYTSSDLLGSEYISEFTEMVWKTLIEMDAGILKMTNEMGNAIVDCLASIDHSNLELMREYRGGFDSLMKKIADEISILIVDKVVKYNLINNLFNLDE